MKVHIILWQKEYVCSIHISNLIFLSHIAAAVNRINFTEPWFYSTIKNVGQIFLILLFCTILTSSLLTEFRTYKVFFKEVKLEMQIAHHIKSYRILYFVLLKYHPRS